MNHDRAKLQQKERTEQQAASAQVQQAQEFATAEYLLRHDSELNPVPPEVAERLNRSIAAEPKPRRPWYRRLFN